MTAQCRPRPSRSSTAALARNPKSLRGRFWLAIFASAGGQKSRRGAYLPRDAERKYFQWVEGRYREAACRVERGAGEPRRGERGASVIPLKAIKSAMIRGMVERLAARLKENGADLDGWLKLIRSYAVFKETDKAQEAVASARTQFASDPQALEQIEVLVRGLGVAGAPALRRRGSERSGDHDPRHGRTPRHAAERKWRGFGWLAEAHPLLCGFEGNRQSARGGRSPRAQFASEPQALEQIEALTARAWLSRR